MCFHSVIICEKVPDGLASKYLELYHGSTSCGHGIMSYIPGTYKHAHTHAHTHVHTCTHSYVTVYYGMLYCRTWTLQIFRTKTYT